MDHVRDHVRDLSSAQQLLPCYFMKIIHFAGGSKLHPLFPHFLPIWDSVFELLCLVIFSVFCPCPCPCPFAWGQQWICIEVFIQKWMKGITETMCYERVSCAIIMWHTSSRILSIPDQLCTYCWRTMHWNGRGPRTPVSLSDHPNATPLVGQV